ncbi:MAG: efflux RND transporter periplasmic adaptor subunit [Sphingobacteriales bacterium]|nr:efflux RND transporter periplasmic adaptor subunit [Sphingobacteriales bacterium]OJY88829.1 MAG: efflux transporter periplasmic adaptor subunit [Sphingobacteriales bacterium 44-15]
MRNILYTLFFSMLFSCHSPQQTEAPKNEDDPNTITLTEAQIKAAGIQTGAIQRHVLNSELKVNGLVDVPPQNIISVSFPLGGYLKSADLLPGMHVSKGEVIAIMQDQNLIQLQQDYLIARAKLEYLEKDYERQKMLNENKVNADKVFQQASADFTSQKVQVKGYEEKLRLIGINPERLNDKTISRTVPIYSPINGFVSKVNINIGKYVNPSDVLFELINPDDIHAALTVFEKDLGKVKPEQKVMVTFVDDPEKEYECEVILVTKNVDNNRSALVHCHFEKQPRQLLPGMFLNARIMINNASVPAVPEDAIVQYGNDKMILESMGNDTFRLVTVQTGITDNGLTEIIDTANTLEGKNIITRNAYPVLAMIKNAGDSDH